MTEEDRRTGISPECDTVKKEYWVNLLGSPIPSHQHILLDPVSSAISGAASPENRSYRSISGTTGFLLQSVDITLLFMVEQVKCSQENREQEINP
jgi:hypothetical protein